MRNSQKQWRFRISWPIRAAVLAALLLWVFVGSMALLNGGVPGYAQLCAGFFVVFFLVFVAYYWSITYVVDEYGVTYFGATDFQYFAWEDITQVKDADFPLGGYYISTRKGGFMLNGFVEHHQKLLDLITQHATCSVTPK